jgi:hypothetical protein
MAVICVFDTPGMTQQQYEQICDRLTGGHGVPKDVSDWPAPGLISHSAGPTADGWLVVDTWESEDAFAKFGEVLQPLLAEAGAGGAPPRVVQAFNVVT